MTKSDNNYSNLWNAVNDRKLYQSVEDPTQEYNDNPLQLKQTVARAKSKKQIQGIATSRPS